MARYRRGFFDEGQQANDNDERYNLAYKRVKRIKGFYIHFCVYLMVNTFIIIANSNKSIGGDEVLWSWEMWSTPVFWGIGLAAHGLSVFGRNVFFGRNWEERKIRELMAKEKDNKWE